ncbi:MAG: Uridine kinase [Marinobacterium sp. xm-d-530]|nr:MAG: Uridine kinase [Marinobacterium sp. xm-d-530]
MARIVGIVGASGSGKSTIADQISLMLSNSGFTVSQFSQDAFYKPIGHPLTNYDEPTALDLDSLASTLKVLKSGNHVNIPTYDFVTHSRQDMTVCIEPTDYVIVEGLFLISDPALRSSFDTTVYLDVSQAECLKRRLKRDQEERGRTPDDIKRQYYDQVLPGFNKYILPFTKFADITIEAKSSEKIALELFEHLNKGKL